MSTNKSFTKDYTQSPEFWILEYFWDWAYKTDNFEFFAFVSMDTDNRNQIAEQLYCEEKLK